MKRYTLFLSLSLLFAPIMSSSRSFSYAEVHNMPKSIEKDYYIWRLMGQKATTKKEVRSISADIKYLSPKIKKAYRKKSGQRIQLVEYRKKAKSMSAAAKAMLKSKQKHASLILKSPDPFKNWLKRSNKMKIFIFNNAGRSGRKVLDAKISQTLWHQLTRYSSFGKSIMRIQKERLGSLQKAFLYPPSKNASLGYNVSMMLGFYALRHDKTDIAISYFDLANKKAIQKEEADRAVFWGYMVSGKKSRLKRLAGSYDVNIYTLLACDMLKLKYPPTITPDLPKADLINPKNISDPIYWAKLKKRIFSKKTNLNTLSKQYKSDATIGYYTYIKSKASRDKEQYFPMPYRKLLKKLPKTRQAILYAIARQESRFIPGSVSSSYALGLMQIMPFLVDHLAKQRGEKIDYDDMFNPRKSLIYANEHMNYLTKWLQHPLFIAYAYNAGIGYTRRMLRKKGFRSNSGYEPYLSIEHLDNEQANKYGKHVITNYVIYMNKLGVPLRMTDLLATLHMPSKTDKFRK